MSGEFCGGIARRGSIFSSTLLRRGNHAVSRDAERSVFFFAGQLMIVGYHTIFGMYGFWLPNDPRGSWSDFVGAWTLFRYGSATKTNDRRSAAHDAHDRAERLASYSVLATARRASYTRISPKNSALRAVAKPVSPFAVFFPEPICWRPDAINLRGDRGKIPRTTPPAKPFSCVGVSQERSDSEDHANRTIPSITTHESDASFF